MLAGMHIGAMAPMCNFVECEMSIVPHCIFAYFALRFAHLWTQNIQYLAQQYLIWNTPHFTVTTMAVKMLPCRANTGKWKHLKQILRMLQKTMSNLFYWFWCTSRKKIYPAARWGLCLWLMNSASLSLPLCGSSSLSRLSSLMMCCGLICSVGHRQVQSSSSNFKISTFTSLAPHLNAVPALAVTFSNSWVSFRRNKPWEKYNTPDKWMHS